MIDGRIGFLGGMNVGREYWRGQGGPLGEWRDMHVRVEGPAVLSMQVSFVGDWLANAAQLCDDARYFPAAIELDDSEGGGQDVQIVSAGPHEVLPVLGACRTLTTASPRTPPNAAAGDRVGHRPGLGDHALLRPHRIH